MGARGSFFGSYAPLPQSGTYIQKLPAPLDRVEQTLPMPDMYQLSDGTMVSGREVDRIYVEQKRRMAGACSTGARIPHRPSFLPPLVRMDTRWRSRAGVRTR